MQEIIITVIKQKIKNLNVHFVCFMKNYPECCTGSLVWSKIVTAICEFLTGRHIIIIEHIYYKELSYNWEKKIYTITSNMNLWLSVRQKQLYSKNYLLYKIYFLIKDK